MKVPQRERGAALLAVLLLVAVTGALAAAGLEKLRLSRALAANGASLDQARAYALGVESLFTLIVDDISGAQRTTLAGGWNGGSRRIPLPGGGLARASVRDGGNCFNLNSVAEGDVRTALRTRPAGVAQLAALMRMLGVARPEAVAAAAADWVDGDSEPNPGGAEDGGYRGYRTGNTLFAEVSELRAVAGVTGEAYARVRPWLCALPTTELSPVNVNTIAAEQAPLVAMLAPGRLSVDAAARAIASRPAAGWESAEAFWRAAGVAPEGEAQLRVKTDWFAVALRVEMDGAELVETALVDARFPPARVAARRWGSEE